MTSFSPAAILRGLALAVLVIAWALLAHYGSATGNVSNFAAALATAPTVAIVVILLWRVANPLWMAIGGLAVLGLLAWFWPNLRQNVAVLYFIQHLGTNLALGILFGRSLFGQRQALVTRFALLAHDGVISAAQERYTRQVTAAWSIFFLINAGVSVALFWLAPPTAWSIFANLLATPLIGLMFAVEQLCRNRILPACDRSGIADTIRGYRASMQRRSRTLANHP